MIGSNSLSAMVPSLRYCSHCGETIPRCIGLFDLALKDNWKYDFDQQSVGRETEGSELFQACGQCLTEMLQQLLIAIGVRHDIDTQWVQLSVVYW